MKNLFYKKYFNTSTTFYNKIFSNEYLEHMYLFINNLQLEKNKDKLEKEIFNFLFNDRKLSKYSIENLNKSKETLKYANSTQKTDLIKKNFIVNTSKFTQFCYDNKLYSENFLEFNKVLFYYMISNHNNIGIRKIYPHFNPSLVLYFLEYENENAHSDGSFKKFVITKLLENIDILKYSQFIYLIEKLSKLVEKNKENYQLLYPINPMKLNREFIIENYFSKINKKFKLYDLLMTMKLPDTIPIAERIFLLENILPYLDLDEYFELIYYTDLISYFKHYHLLNLEFKLNNKFLSDKAGRIFEDYFIKVNNKIKYRYKNTKVDKFCHRIDTALKSVDEFIENAKFFDDIQIFEDLLSVVIKTAEKVDVFRHNLDNILLKFIEVHPKFVFKIFFDKWTAMVNNNKSIGYDSLIGIIKFVIYSKIKENNQIFDDKSSQFLLIKEYLRNLYLEKNKLMLEFETKSLNQYVELTFYLTYLYKFKMINIDDETFSKFIISRMKFIIDNLKYKVEISLDEMLIEEIFDNTSSFQKFSFENFDLNKNKISLDYLFLLCEYFKNEDTQELIDEIEALKLEISKLFSKDKYYVMLNSKYSKFIKSNCKNFNFVILFKFNTNLHYCYLFLKSNNNEPLHLVKLDTELKIKKDLFDELGNQFYLSICKDKGISIIENSIEVLNFDKLSEITKRI